MLMPQLRTLAWQVIRLTGEQSAFRPVPVIADLSEASPSSIANVPRARQQGDFNFFVVDKSMAGVPYAVSVADQCASAAHANAAQEACDFALC